VRIRSVAYSTRKRVFEVRTTTKKRVFPFAKAEPTPTLRDPITDLFVDPEAGREAFTYVLHSGRTGTAHVEHVLEYNRDLTYLRDLLLYRLTLEAQKRIAESALSKREIVRGATVSTPRSDELPQVRRPGARTAAGDHCDVDLVVRTKTA
jgi:hypothetical protein